MNSKNQGSSRKRIIFYYALAVILPGVFLGYMAYRGIRNDQALRDKESLRKLDSSSQLFFSAIDSSLVQFMKEQTADSMVSEAWQYDPSILAFSIKDSIGSRKLITHQLLYLPVELLMIKPEPSVPSTNLEEGNRLEFAELRFSDAIRFYEDKIIRSTTTSEKIQSMVALARLYNKTNQSDRAKAMYDKIRKDYPGSLLNNQIPLGLIAGLEILKINQVVGENEELRNNSRKYLELLLHPQCEYDKNQFYMFYHSFQKIIKETDPGIDSLFKVIESRRVITDYIIRILNEPDLFSSSGSNQFKESKKGMSIIPINSDELVAIYLLRNDKNGIQTGMVIDFKVYLKSRSAKLIDKLDQDSSINIKIEDNKGTTVYSMVNKEESEYLSFPFPENFPKCKLLLSENSPGFITSLLKAGSGIYLTIFILIALLMVLGFVFTMYTLNVELRLNKLKSEFISNVSHELKSPLTSIRMMTEMLHNDRVDSEERKSIYYSTMLEECEHLSHLIDNILDFSRMDDESRKYDFVDLDLDELLLKFIESMRESIPESSFDIRYNNPGRIPVIKGDKNAIIQVFYNLIDNAVKFSGASRQIDINLFSGDDEVHFCVKDYGIGISLKDQAKIFDRFYRSEESQQLGIKGSGIGLTIVKKIIEAHKGRLTLESKPGEGSTFCVHLPIN